MKVNHYVTVLAASVGVASASFRSGIFASLVVVGVHEDDMFAEGWMLARAWRRFRLAPIQDYLSSNSESINTYFCHKVKGREQLTSLHMAALSGDPELTKELLRQQRI